MSDFVFILIVQFMKNAMGRMRFCLEIVFVCLYITPSHYHHCANLSEDIELHCQIYFVECVGKTGHILWYPLYNIWGCVFSVYPFSLWWLREYILCFVIIVKSWVRIISHCLELRHETMACAVCPSIFLSYCVISYCCLCWMYQAMTVKCNLSYIALYRIAVGERCLWVSV